MSDEEKVSHDDLDASLEEAAPEVAATEPETDVEPAAAEAAAEEEKPAFTPEEPSDNDERSMLGRKVKAIGDQLEAFSQQLEPILNRFNTTEEEETDDIVTTKADVIKVLRSETAQVNEQKAAYAKTAETSLIDLGLAENLDEATHIAVFKDAQANWKGRTGDASLDAEMNFKDALLRHTRKQIKKQSVPVNPLEKNKDKDEEALGGGAETAVKPKKVAVPEMDDYAKEFVSKTGMKPESVAEALTGDAPTYLLGKG